jgi:hypothetical protein
MPEMFATLDRARMLKDFSNVSETYMLNLRYDLNEGARKHLHHGLLVRVNMLEESAVILDEELQSADGSLSSYLATKLTLLLNAYYLNLAGSLDNLAWAMVYHHAMQEEINEDEPRQRQFAQLLGKKFLTAIQQRGLTSLHKKIQGFNDWYWEMRKFRDPAAHRIPVLVPCSIYTEKDILEANRLDAEASGLFVKGEHAEGMNTFRQTYQLGEQLPVFISETTSVRMYDLAERLNLDHANWYSIVSAVLSEGFSLPIGS